MSRRKRETAPFSLFAFQDVITSVTGIVVFITLILTLQLLTKTLESPASQNSDIVATTKTALEQVQTEIESLQHRLDSGVAIAESSARLSPTQIERDSYETREQTKRLKEETQSLQEQLKALDAQKDKVAASQFDRQSDREHLNALQAEAEDTRKKIEQLRRSNRVIFNPTGSSMVAWLVDISGSRLQVAQVGENARPLVFKGTSPRAALENMLTWAKSRSRTREYFVLIVRPSGIDAFRTLRSRLEQKGFRIGYDVIASDQTVLDPVHGAGHELQVENDDVKHK